jgi:uncharacterized membrane protein (UPF0127 family)
MMLHKIPRPRRAGAAAVLVGVVLLGASVLLAPPPGYADTPGEAGATNGNRAPALSPLRIMTDSGPVAFRVELASTPDEQARGLQERRSLAADAGMLFDFGRGSHVTMWMKDTYIPLDMFFIADDGRIIAIVERTEPLSLATIPSPGPVRAVLEVLAGTASRLGIRAGDRVEHAIFTTR